MSAAKCPYCDEHIRFEKSPRLGWKVTCRNCGEPLEVVHLNPLTLDFDMDDTDDDYEYDDNYEDEEVGSRR